jgi:hypothetical protein
MLNPPALFHAFPALVCAIMAQPCEREKPQTWARLARWAERPGVWRVFVFIRHGFAFPRRPADLPDRLIACGAVVNLQPVRRAARNSIEIVEQDIGIEQRIQHSLRTPS